MTTDQRHGACATPEAQTTQSQREWILAAVLFGLLVVEGIREGGFWPSDSLFVAIASIVVLVVGHGARAARPPLHAPRRQRRAPGPVVARPRAHRGDDPQLPASRRQHAGLRRRVRRGAPAGRPSRESGRSRRGLPRSRGRAGRLRRPGLALVPDGHTHAGALADLDDADLLRCGRARPRRVPPGGARRGPVPPARRGSPSACAPAGCWPPRAAVPTWPSSCACLLVPWRRYVRFAVPLVAGIALGVAAIASSPDTSAVPWLAVVVVAAAAVSAVARRDDGVVGWSDSRAFGHPDSGGPGRHRRRPGRGRRGRRGVCTTRSASAPWRRATRTAPASGRPRSINGDQPHSWGSGPTGS